MKYQLIYPMAFYVFYIWVLAVYMFRTRVKAIKSKEVSYKFFQTYSGDSPQEYTVRVARHYDNQFQVPMLFLITCAAHMALDQAGYTTLVLAWVFVATRLAHSFVHLGSNNLRKRVLAFACGWLVLLIMWGRLALSVFGV